MRPSVAILPPVLGAPYLELGRTPAGWDCGGAVKWCRRELFGLETPGFADDYDFAQVRDPARAAAIIEGQRALWRPCAPEPGAVALFTWFGRRAHVGMMTTRREFVHCDAGIGTCVEQIDSPRHARRFVGCFDAV